MPSQDDLMPDKNIIGVPLFMGMIFFMGASVAVAEESAWRTSWDGTLYGYVNNTGLRADSVLNPGNQIARLPQRSQTAELRFNFKAENEDLRLALRPIVKWQQSGNVFGNQTKREAYLSQGQLRWRVAEAWSLAAGREVLNWGPGQFRSPANPFYFDNGRSDPMRELSGLDVLKLSWTPDTRSTLSFARIAGTGHYAGNIDTWRDTWLIKSDQRGERWAGGLALAKKTGQGAFVGAHLQYTLNDALLLYGELGSSTRVNALQSPPDAALPFSVVAESARRSNELLGATYTFDNGQSLTGEYLHQGHGFAANEETAYFARAANAALPAGAATLGMALATAPPLLARDYLHLVWQNSLLESSGYWRLMLTHNFNDGGSELSGYGEYTLSGRMSGFVLVVFPQGGVRQELSALTKRMVTLGVKFAFP